MEKQDSPLSSQVAERSVTHPEGNAFTWTAINGEALLELAPQFFSAVANCVVRLFRSARLQRLRVRFAGGLGDPAMTGYAFGVYCAIASAVPLGARFVFTPDYLATRLVYSVTGEIRLRPIMVLWAIGILLIKAPLWRMTRILRWRQ